MIRYRTYRWLAQWFNERAEKLAWTGVKVTRW